MRLILFNAALVLFLCNLAIGTITLNSLRRDQAKKKTLPYLNLKWLPNGVKDGMASALAATVAKTILQPLDTVKTLQQQARSLQASRGPFQTAFGVVRSRGVFGLWSGLGVTVLGSAPSVALYFGTYTSIKSFLSRRFPNNFKVFNVVVSASVANSLASLLRAPFEVIKQRVQAGVHSSPMAAVATIWRADGLGGFFSHGQLTSQIIRDVPYAVLTLLSYELLQTALKRHTRLRSKLSKDSADSVEGSIAIPSRPAALSDAVLRSSDAVCGALAGGLSSFLTNPMDVIKTRMMTTREYSSVGEAVLRIVREEGVGSLYSGCTMRLMHKIPANGLFFLCYEAFRDLLGVVRSTGL